MRLMRFHPCRWGLPQNSMAFVVWALLVFALSSLPGPALPEIETGLPLDKIAHFGLYALGGALLSGLLLRHRRLRGIPAAAAAVLFLALFALLDEWYQSFTPGRTGTDPFDWLADLLGAAVGVTLTYTTHGIAKGRGRKADQ